VELCLKEMVRVIYFVKRLCKMMHYLPDDVLVSNIVFRYGTVYAMHFVLSCCLIDYVAVWL